jgi:hypothetical protein
MNRIKIIDEQAQQTREFTKKLIYEVPEDKWYTTPQQINSNIAWQVGHLIMSQNFHSITVVAGANEKIKETIPLKEYAALYAMGATPLQNREAGPLPSILKRQLDFVDMVAREVLFALSDDELDNPLVTTGFPHPVAKTKYEALTWSFKHEMWHCGQISMIKRIIGIPTKWV